MSDSVQDQYEAYPYPSRDPRDEHKRLITGSPSNLDELNHYLFAGRRDFAKPFRALVAGGGTGDATIMLAQQLADRCPEGEVVYLDLSTASRAVAEARAAERGLSNITFHSGSLLDLPEMGLEAFDYIDCCGVLHHLKQPEDGLDALKTVLKQDGGMGLMVYATHGRTGLYPTQDMLRALGNDLPLETRIEQVRRLLEALPPTNWLRRNPFLGDHKRSDAELVDLLLHSQDRAYSVEEVGEFVASAGLNLVSFIEPARYRPESYLKDPKLLTQLRDKSDLGRAGFAEKLAGNIKTHVFYVSRKDDCQAQPEPHGAAIPFLCRLENHVLAASLRKNPVLSVTFDGLPLRFNLPRLAAAMVERIDGKTTVAEIYASLAELDPHLERATFDQQFAQTYEVLNGVNHLLLRA
ncbi:class I SAM-dependent methyltransferase [Denitrobaculum tricleocarpae]|uniref:Class I SAM-dependent methyltransferase n=1 Tax=Denitrobaculum tricleocarpae TaxID=2591009 RepID=A0A545TR46_9PROT|nr:class I SAM-dependent methyltransferase [Denitrobaculum tricleocarpae]TQV79686.1 class I SAM-dependent methyltransferase [Denitrobaculum tricleocarpae]